MDYVSGYRQMSINSSVVLETKFSDVNGDDVVDAIYLTGSKNMEKIVVEDIKILIRDGRNMFVNKIDLRVDKGYGPHLFLGDFTGDGIDDILISIESGNTGREGYFYIYSFVGDVEKLLFDFEEFNKKYRYEVMYEDGYIVRVISGFDEQEFKIDISGRSNDYLAEIYDGDGTLKKPLRGVVSPLIDLSPIPNSLEKRYYLRTTQRIVGYYNADTLGMITTILKWDGRDFAPDNKSTLQLFGPDKNVS